MSGWVVRIFSKVVLAIPSSWYLKISFIYLSGTLCVCLILSRASKKLSTSSSALPWNIGSLMYDGSFLKLEMAPLLLLPPPSLPATTAAAAIVDNAAACWFSTLRESSLKAASNAFCCWYYCYYWCLWLLLSCKSLVNLTFQGVP